MPCSMRLRGETFQAAVNKTVCYLVLVAVLLLAGSLERAAAVNKDAWVLVESTAAGQIYHREMAASPIPWIMIVATFEATPGRVHAVVVDYDHFSEFIPHVLQSRVLAEAGNQQWVYHHLGFPAPVADRSYVIRSTDVESRPAQPHYRVDWALDDRSFPGVEPAAGIRPAVFSGFWELNSVAGSNTTVAQYAVHSEPGGFIPGWLVTRMTERYVQQVVQAVRERLAAGG
jgi:hypothetical protein